MFSPLPSSDWLARKVATISLMSFGSVSQIDQGVVNLINEEDPRITVLLDCHGISPFRIPMQMMRSFITVVQENYPNRLGVLFVVRLPPVVRVIAQTFLQVSQYFHPHVISISLLLFCIVFSVPYVLFYFNDELFIFRAVIKPIMLRLQKVFTTTMGYFLCLISKILMLRRQTTVTIVTSPVSLGNKISLF